MNKYTKYYIHPSPGLWGNLLATIDPQPTKDCFDHTGWAIAQKSYLFLDDSEAALSYNFVLKCRRPPTMRWIQGMKARYPWSDSEGRWTIPLNTPCFYFEDASGQHIVL